MDCQKSKPPPIKPGENVGVREAYKGQGPAGLCGPVYGILKPRLWVCIPDTKLMSLEALGKSLNLFVFS